MAIPYTYIVGDLSLDSDVYKVMYDGSNIRNGMSGRNSYVTIPGVSGQRAVGPALMDSVQLRLKVRVTGTYDGDLEEALARLERALASPVLTVTRVSPGVPYATQSARLVSMTTAGYQPGVRVDADIILDLPEIFWQRDQRISSGHSVTQNGTVTLAYPGTAPTTLAVRATGYNITRLKLTDPATREFVMWQGAATGHVMLDAGQLTARVGGTSWTNGTEVSGQVTASPYGGTFSPSLAGLQVAVETLASGAISNEFRYVPTMF